MNEQDQYISIPSKNNIEGYCEIIISFLQHVILDRQYSTGVRFKYFMVGCKIQCL